MQSEHSDVVDEAGLMVVNYNYSSDLETLATRKLTKIPNRCQEGELLEKVMLFFCIDTEYDN